MPGNKNGEDDDNDDDDDVEDGKGAKVLNDALVTDLILRMN